MATGKLMHLLQRLKQSDRVHSLTSRLPPLNFITVHYLYFITTCLICSVVFWGSSHPEKSVSYTDSLFLVISAMTEAGLNTVNLSQITTFQQALLCFLIIIGSSIFVSISTVLTRKRVFENRLKHVVRLQKEARHTRKRSMSMIRTEELPAGNTINGSRKPDEPMMRSDLNERVRSQDDTADPMVSSMPLTEEQSIAITQTTEDLNPMTSELSDHLRSDSGHSNGNLEIPNVESDASHISFMRYGPSPPLNERRFLTFTGVGASPNATGYKSPYPASIYNRANRKEQDQTPAMSDGGSLDHGNYPNYLTRYTTGRNAQFFGLSREQREHLGGVEYQAITLLSWIVPIYFVLWQFLGCLGLGAYIAHNKAKVSEDNGINPWWLGIFNGISAFNNSGMSLLDMNMIPFQTSTYALVTMGLLILAGNTAYPLLLRLMLWCMLRFLNIIYPSPDHYTDYKATLRFILTYPRRVYTNLFPATQSWWLLIMLITLNGIDWVAFEVLNIGNASTAVIPHGYRVLDGLFQALAVRSGGFYIISIPTLRIGLQFLYVIMMYISVYPVVITMRHSNVYEERSLGIYADDAVSIQEPDPLPPKLGTLTEKIRRTITSTISHPFNLSAPDEKYTRTQFVRQQIRGQLAHDLWWLAIAVFIIACVEVSNFERDPVVYSVFNIIFEVVSGYGCVGISTGLSDQAYSFSGGWHAASKLVLCAVMLRGRHRGLPVALDRAVRLPGREPGEMEEEDQMFRRASSFWSARNTPMVGGGPLGVEDRQTPQMKNLGGLGLKQM